MTPDLPPDLRQAVDRLMEGRGRKDLSARAQKISDTYRAGAGPPRSSGRPTTPWPMP